MAENESLGNKALKGTIWASVDRFSTIGIQFIVNLVLARLLLPSDFGAIGMLVIFIGVSQVIIDGGFISAIIQKKQPTQTDYSTIFYWNVGLALILYAILYLSAPLIAHFYRMPILSPVLRALGLWLIVFSINVVQTAQLRKRLQFKAIAIANLSAIVSSGAIAILLALNGYGIWSLVVQQISYGAVTTIVYYFLTFWHPSVTFSLATLNQLFKFGGYMFIATVLQEICRNFQGIIIGRRFSATYMGYYTQAQRLDMVTSNALPQVIAQVMYPVYSSIQDDLQHMQKILTINIRIISFIIFPLLGALIIAAKPIMEILYGAKWLPCASFFQILCVGGLFSSLQNVNYYAVAAMGKSRQLFLWSFYKWGFMIAAMFIGMLFGIFGLMWGLTASSINIYIVNAWLADRHIGFSLKRQLSLLLPPLSIVATSTLVGFLLISYLDINAIIAAIIALLLYLMISFSLHTKGFIEAQNIAKRLINRKK